MNVQNIENQILKACKRIAPAWPLKNSVAVNPYLGMADMTFQEATKTLSERSDIDMTMPIQFYLEEIQKNRITDIDIRAALNQNSHSEWSNESFLKEIIFLSISNNAFDRLQVRTVLDVSEELTNKNWNEYMIDKISSWASSYFDEYQASWNTTNASEVIFQSWKEDAQIDLSAELMGIKNFRSSLKQIPDNSAEAAAFILKKLEIPEEALETYLHTLLLKPVGWSSYVAGEDWNNSLYSGSSDNLQSFLSILLCWEYCLLESFKAAEIEAAWKFNKIELQNFKGTEGTDDYLEARMILQDAYDLACQRELQEKFEARQLNEVETKRPKAQAIFCIDVRSEVYRRNLESADSEIETIGFAGFFGFPINFIPLAHKEGKNQCPVLIPSGPIVKEALIDKNNTQKANTTRVVKHQVEKTWKNFKSGAISSFGFVSPMGMSYLPKILSDSFGWTRPADDPNKDGLSKMIDKGRDLDLSEISLESKVSMASGALTGMGLTERLAPIVLITGHGSSSVNNPHATGLDCGACGGHSGEINAMTAEKILNDKEVRRELSKNGIQIPEDTHFVACLHDTTTDEIHIIGQANIPETHTFQMAAVQRALETASVTARKERSQRLGITSEDVDNSIFQRSKDWSQVRPEWGLAGCSSFIIAPRNRTAGINLKGEAFLHSYDWKTDKGFKILESIMCAPMVVTSWINLQYYASTTDNKHFGAGNKTLHNVTGGIGVLEGSGGDLRIGLPLQSIHNGKEFQHLPRRLNVAIEAPIEAINEILEKNPNIKELCDNAWITLLSIDENGKINKKYCGNFEWKETVNEVIENKEQLITI